MTIPDKSPDPISSSKAAEPLQTPTRPGGTGSGFESYMQGTGERKLPPGAQPPASNVNPMEMARGASLSTSGLSFETLLAQAGQTQDALGTVHKQLNDKNLKLKRPQSHLVRQKLGDANGYLRAAAGKLGLEPNESKVPAGVSGITRFIAMINDGQDQLAAVQAQLKKMSANAQNVNPADMMTVQVKMGLAQQEISYTSTLLGKVIQSITQLMNTQL